MLINEDVGSFDVPVKAAAGQQQTNSVEHGDAGFDEQQLLQHAT
jgi:hypothetical protein